MLKIKFTYFKYLHLSLLLLSSGVVNAQLLSKPWIDSIQEQASRYNKKGEFDKSIKMFNDALKSDSLSAEDRFNIYRLKSYTYKWLGDYVSVERNLTLALQAAAKTKNKLAFSASIQTELACMWFDTQQYEKADSVMKVIRSYNFKYQDDYEKSTLLMQEAYLLFLKKDYSRAESLYSSSLQLMEQSDSHCNTPIIYWKTLALYLAQGELEKADRAVKNGLTIAQECGIQKYTMYMLGEASTHYAKNGYYKQAYEFSKMHDSVKTALDQAVHLTQIAGLEKEFQTERDREQQQLAKKTLEAQTNFNYLLIAILAAILFLIISTLMWRSAKKAKNNKKLKSEYNKKFLNKLEEERKRIAVDLHDGVSHELLTLKNLTENHALERGKIIDDIINNIRSISRNLHPIMFEKIGLSISLNHLINRLQETTKFVITAEIDYHNGLSNDKELQLYRIVQEALSNVIKYSNAHAAKLMLTQNDKQVELLIMDNGVGFKLEEKLESGLAFGLHSMMERSEAIGGEAKISSTDKGTTIIVKIPLHD